MIFVGNPSTVLPSYSREVLGAGPDVAALRAAALRALDSCRAALDARE
jgi:orotidine-5'-phosphate decarboxylase